MTFERIDNFLPDYLFDRVQSILLGSDRMEFPYYYRTGLTTPEDYGFCFGNTLYNTAEDDLIQLEFFNRICIPVVSRMSISELLRIKVNCYPRTADHVKSSLHVDYDHPHMVGLYSVNTCNGWTEFENGEKAGSIANSMVIFDGNTKHQSVSQTDEELRVNLNINFI